MVDEIPLTGGNVANGVVRIGETVRKPPTPFDPAISALLKRFDEAGINGVPRCMGNDAQGRRVLSWVKGETTFPEAMWTSQITIETAARRLRAIHDASLPLTKAEFDWAYKHPGPMNDPVIGHSDFAPYNMTFAEDGAVCGIFDFDLAGPAPRGRDLAYLAWWMVPLGRQDPRMAEATARDLATGSTRLKSLCTIYGLPADAAFLEMIAEVLNHMGSQTAAASMIGRNAAEKLAIDGHFDHWRRAAADFQELRPQISANLGRNG